MTDITELAQRVERIISDVKLKHGGNDTYAPIMKWDEFSALVEALEKAQETIAFQQGEIKALLSSLESRTVTVKLPQAVSAGGQGYQEQVERILTAAGIKVEAE
ncbi:TPA: hypothetical protein MAK17_001885 [Klebsiella pneumoniae]|uniref:hypothetical protein n=1 Tax=Klebsiella pneumoniae TaxID=573 RepID=UPI002442C141|nr:hypothetical protein [Klebsiella pneumoniae]WGF35696.1 hypothetical protein QCC56_09710 [Klebsiella pneumoniae]HBS5590984.1 hypothetical protein [Klebsiella pneumoniae]